MATEPDRASEITHSSDHRFIPSTRCAVEPLVHAPETVQAARVGRVSVVDDPVLERERAHAGGFPRNRRGVRAKDGQGLFVDEFAAGIHPAEVVIDGARPLLLLGEGTPKS